MSQSVEDYRRANRISQTEIARALGVDQSRISARLKGKTRWTLDDVETLAGAFPDFAIQFPLFTD